MLQKKGGFTKNFSSNLLISFLESMVGNGFKPHSLRYHIKFQKIIDDSYPRFEILEI